MPSAGERAYGAGAMRVLITVLWVSALAYVLFGAYLYLFQERLVYLPTATVVATPAERGMPYEGVTLSTEDGETLDAWFVPAGQQRAVLLFAHGNVGNIGDRLASLEQFHRLGLSVLIFDYRGYGRSTGTPTEAGTYRDAEAAWHYLVDQRRVPSQHIVVFGRSLGGAVAAELARHHRPGALILESTFLSGRAMARRMAPLYPPSLIARLEYNTGAKLPYIDCPLLIIHSANDEMIPFEHARDLFEHATEPKQLLSLHGDHNAGFLIDEHRYLDGIAGFLDRHLPQRGDT